MENRKEPMSVSQWLDKNYPSDHIPFSRRKIMQEYADYIKSFQPESSPIDWEKLKKEYGRVAVGHVHDAGSGLLIFDWFKQRISPIDNSVEFAEWIVKTYEDDGMENMHVREHAIYEEAQRIFLNQKDKK